MIWQKDSAKGVILSLLIMLSGCSALPHKADQKVVSVDAYLASDKPLGNFQKVQATPKTTIYIAEQPIISSQDINSVAYGKNKRRVYLVFRLKAEGRAKIKSVVRRYGWVLKVDGKIESMAGAVNRNGNLLFLVKDVNNARALIDMILPRIRPYQQTMHASKVSKK